MIKSFSFVASVGVIIFTTPLHAHHSFSATFTDQVITVEGVVDEYKFINPHVVVHFNVTDENGEVTRWMTEGDAATLMRGRGWAKDSIERGDTIRVTGNSTRNGSPMVSTDNLVFVDPATGKVTGTPAGEIAPENVVTLTQLTLADGKPNLTGAWTRGAGGRNVAGDGGMAMAGGGGMGGGMSGRGGTTMPYNEAGAALQAVFDPVNDPQVQCEPPGLVRQAASTPHPVKITQHDDHVVLEYEEYGSVRTIYFDDRDIGGDEKTHLGQSTARYEGQKLIIETTHLLANLTSPGGNGISDQSTTVETYHRNENADGQSSLTMDMVVTDPGYLTEPWTRSWTKSYTGGYEFIANDCQKPLAY